jgi:aerobic-type carbon monoxide dehydrogenase small subunit (CoxS/CutS family)
MAILFNRYPLANHNEVVVLFGHSIAIREGFMASDHGDDDPRTVVSTRRQFIKGVIASGASVSAAGYLFRGSLVGPAQAKPAGASERLITLNVNGRDRRVDVLPQETLVQTLRNKLGLTGTKEGCNHGECGACTVLVDDVAVYSCSTLTQRMRGKKIVTIEGLEGPDGALHPVQKAFIAELAPQCGFCAPGQVMAAVALLKANPHPTPDQVRQALAGNLCRCGAYDHYVNGVIRAAAEA